ncbi:MAG: DUF302 domain-containing protein [Bacteroidetes bacterium]|nr:DUF302 domain-containing protein [Bacteroidota bacterium]
MKYFLSKTIKNTTMDAVRTQVTAALQKEGFGVLTEIDLQATMKKKLNKDYLPHVILGACNPVYADKVLSTDPHMSTMLPCNVTLRQTESGEIELATIDPVAAMNPVGDKNIESLANEVRSKLLKVIDSI